MEELMSANQTFEKYSLNRDELYNDWMTHRASTKRGVSRADAFILRAHPLISREDRQILCLELRNMAKLRTGVVSAMSQKPIKDEIKSPKLTGSPKVSLVNSPQPIFLSSSYEYPVYEAKQLELEGNNYAVVFDRVGVCTNIFDAYGRWRINLVRDGVTRSRLATDNFLRFGLPSDSSLVERYWGKSRTPFTSLKDVPPEEIRTHGSRRSKGNPKSVSDSFKVGDFIYKTESNKKYGVPPHSTVVKVVHGWRSYNSFTDLESFSEKGKRLIFMGRVAALLPEGRVALIRQDKFYPGWDKQDAGSFVKEPGVAKFIRSALGNSSEYPDAPPAPSESEPLVEQTSAGPTTDGILSDVLLSDVLDAVSRLSETLEGVLTRVSKLESIDDGIRKLNDSFESAWKS